MDEQKTYSFEQMLEYVVDTKIADVHTAMPGIIELFDETTQTVKVSPSLRRIFDDGTAIEIPPIINCPIQYPTAGGWSITFPVKSGDECLIVFSERAIDTWMQSGGVQDPLDKRKHDLTDAIAILGIRSNTRKLSSYSTDSLQIRNDNASTYINVTNESIQLEINGGGATFNDDGSVDFANGAKITALGGFVNGPLAVPGINVGLGTHTHSAPGQPPTPGT